MKKETLIQPIHRAAFKPKQIMLIDSDSRKAAKNWSVRPITLLAVPLLLILLGVLIDQYYQPKQTTSSNLSAHIQLQKRIDHLHNQLATAEANNEVKQAKILGLEGIIKQQQDTIIKTNKRLHVFESILEARKNRGTKLLRAAIKTINDKSFSFSITLVKGGNYPRRLQGSIRFVTQDKQGKDIRLLLRDKQSTLPFRMETHIFLQGQLHWPNKIAKPEHINDIIAIVSDSRGKELTRETCTFEDF